MWLKACLNGGRAPGDHPALPLTPDELAADARAVAGQGASAVHAHPRDAAGRESLDASDIGAAVAAIRAAVPMLPTGVSTGLWITGGDVDARLAAVRRWASLPDAERPDFASCNLSEPGFADLAVTLLDGGIGVEAGVWSPQDADALAASGVAGRVVRVLVEIIDVPADEAVPAAARVLHRLDALGVTAARLLHGGGTATWPLLEEAARLGLPGRVGLEDVLCGPSGEPVSGNAELVRLALGISSRG
ncbi:3-keto-5-aminohexanoate cleavage protein [Sphaerisporangium sp. NPDC051011]|uniref:3-keto-5-aminohexanoate cleavage protein n=1 Tax=Sphaerisporangium sp. NPDC051011 TaxID=3155792 RepID=UPI0033D22AD1